MSEPLLRGMNGLGLYVEHLVRISSQSYHLSLDILRPEDPEAAFVERVRRHILRHLELHTEVSDLLHAVERQNRYPALLYDVPDQVEPLLVAFDEIRMNGVDPFLLGIILLVCDEERVVLVHCLKDLWKISWRRNEFLHLNPTAERLISSQDFRHAEHA